MKSVIFVLCILLLFSGCTAEDIAMRDALSFRDKLLGASECSFSAQIVADYGDSVHTFEVDTKADSSGNLSFTVVSPETISGISGTIGQTGPTINYDDQILAFQMLADGQLAPVAAPWVFLKALRSGYISSAVKEGEHWRLSLNDSYEENAMVLDVWLDGQWNPLQCRIYYNGEDILTLQLENFRTQ